jgi:heptosyltransferase I
VTQRILIVRLSAIGDVVMASGLLPALRARFPGAQISWLTEPMAEPLLRHHTGLTEVIVWRRSQWQQLWRERRWGELWRQVRAFRAELRARRFDLVLDAQGLLKSGVLAWFTGAPRRMGLRSREGSRWLMHECVEPGPSTGPVRMGQEYRWLAQWLGAPEGSFRQELALGGGAQAQARATRQAHGVAAGQAFAALAPFTTRPQKHWVEASWAEVGAALLRQGLTPVLLGGPADGAAAQRIAAACPGMVNLAGRLALDETVATVADARVLLGVDTGLTHMGAALNRPTVAIFGSTVPYREAGVPGFEVLYTPRACSPCRRHPTCGGRFDCMRDWQPADVLAAAQRQMEVLA